MNTGGRLVRRPGPGTAKTKNKRMISGEKKRPFRVTIVVHSYPARQCIERPRYNVYVPTRRRSYFGGVFFLF